MSFFWKLVDETQKCNPPEATRYHNSRKYLSFYPSEPFRILRFNMRHPVLKNVHLHFYDKINAKGFKYFFQIWANVFFNPFCNKGISIISDKEVFNLLQIFCSGYIIFLNDSKLMQTCQRIPNHVDNSRRNHYHVKLAHWTKIWDEISYNRGHD